MFARTPPMVGVDTSDTALRRILRRIAPQLPSRTGPIRTHSRLMEESERRLASAAHSAIESEVLVATRILDSPSDFRRWEDEHAVLMRRVATEHRDSAQKLALRAGTLALIHRKALFEYLREHRVRGGDRQRLLAHFHSGTDYASSVIAEHGNYLRSAASYICSCHVGRRLMLDGLFAQAVSRYEQAYTQYFGAFCEVALAKSEDEAAGYSRSLLIPLKQEVLTLREGLLGAARSRFAPSRKLAESAA